MTLISALSSPDKDVGRRKITEKDRDILVLVHKVDKLRFGTDKGSALWTKLSKIAIFVEICPISAPRAPLVNEAEK